MIPQQFPSLSELYARQVVVFPQHSSYLEQRFADQKDMAFADWVAAKVIRIAGGELDTFCEDYCWLSAIMLEEELYFHRAGKYRLSSFAEAEREVYANPAFMRRYMNGVLLSQIWWGNHAAMLCYFQDRFLPGNQPGFRHLEIGPGHGLYLHLAAIAPHCGYAKGWDVSATSLAKTAAALSAVQPNVHVALEQISVEQTPAEEFDSLAFSEVLEHLERPAAALAQLFRLLVPGGRLFLNVPVNSPAPDHIFLFSTPEEVTNLAAQAGFEIVEALCAPMTGVSLDRARKLVLPVSVGVIARKPD